MRGDGNGQNVGRESADDEESENGFADHDDRECRKRERIATAPGLKLHRYEKGIAESCTAAEDPTEPTSILLYPSAIPSVVRSDALSSFSFPLVYIVLQIAGRVYPNDRLPAENQITA